MALKKSDLRAILKNEDSTHEEKISEILNLLHEEVDAVKDNRDDLQKKLDEALEAKNTNSNKEYEALKEKYDAVVAEYESYKGEQSAKEIKANKETALKKLLKDVKIDDGLHETIISATDLNSIELEDGAVKDAEAMMETLKGKYANYIMNEATQGAKTDIPPAGNYTKFSHEDIAKMSADEINKNWDSIKESLNN